MVLAEEGYVKLQVNRPMWQKEQWKQNAMEGRKVQDQVYRKGEPRRSGGSKAGGEPVSLDLD